MSIGGGIFLMAIGAILSFGVKDRWSGIDLVVIGYILMVAGLLTVLIGLFLSRRRTVQTTSVQAAGNPVLPAGGAAAPGMQDGVIREDRRDTY